MYGIDISNYQNKIDLSRGNFDFAIMKATEGIGFRDKSFHKFAVQLTELNKLMGCYHFARPDLHTSVSDMEKEADWFIETVKGEGLLNKAILALDWETEPMDREDLVQAWVLRVESKSGITPFIYGSRSKLNKWKSWWVIQHCPIWMAAWPTMVPMNVGEPWKGDMASGRGIDWCIWQYSSTGRFPGFNGNVDLDYCSFDAARWMVRAGQKEEEKEIISDDMKWAIDLGLFRGYGNGKYGPKDSLTREQMASVLRRYNYLINGDTTK